MAKLTMDKLTALAKGRGFVYPGSEIYGGLANTWDYGPLGVELKNNIKKAWWQKFVTENHLNVGLDCAILMNPNVWVASGHVGGFSDPLMDCKSCKARHRADNLIEEYNKKNGIEMNIAAWSHAEMEAYIKEHEIKCPVCGKSDFTGIRQFNLMFKTFQGVTEDTVSTLYLRPETAQGIFVNFLNVQRTSRMKVPFGIGQVGKSFRNEITPGNFIFRVREFEQMELEVLLLDAEAEKPILAEFLPIRKPLKVGARLAEELQLHLLELSDAEDEVSGSNLVTEGLADLTDAERHLHSRGSLHVQEIDEYALRRLGAEIQRADAVLGDALKGLEHQVELTNAREVRLAADGALDLVLLDIRLHFGVRPRGDIHLDAVLLIVVLDEVIRTVTRLAALAVHQGIGETAHVTRRDPHVGVHQDRAVETDVQVILGHELLPPSFLDIVFQLHAERAVVPSIRETAVDFAAGIYEAASLCESGEFVHSEFRHNMPPIYRDIGYIHNNGARDKSQARECQKAKSLRMMK